VYGITCATSLFLSPKEAKNAGWAGFQAGIAGWIHCKWIVGKKTFSMIGMLSRSNHMNYSVQNSIRQKVLFGMVYKLLDMQKTPIYCGEQNFEYYILIVPGVLAQYLWKYLSVPSPCEIGYGGN